MSHHIIIVYCLDYVPSIGDGGKTTNNDNSEGSNNIDMQGESNEVTEPDPPPDEPMVTQGRAEDSK